MCGISMSMVEAVVRCWMQSDTQAVVFIYVELTKSVGQMRGAVAHRQNVHKIKLRNHDEDSLATFKMPPDGPFLEPWHPFHPVVPVYEAYSHLPLLPHVGKPHLEVGVFSAERVRSLKTRDFRHRVRQISDTPV